MHKRKRPADQGVARVLPYLEKMNVGDTLIIPVHKWEARREVQLLQHGVHNYSRTTGMKKTFDTCDVSWTSSEGLRVWRMT